MGISCILMFIYRNFQILRKAGGKIWGFAWGGYSIEGAITENSGTYPATYSLTLIRWWWWSETWDSLLLLSMTNLFLTILTTWMIFVSFMVREFRDSRNISEEVDLRGLGSWLQSILEFLLEIVNRYLFLKKRENWSWIEVMNIEISDSMNFMTAILMNFDIWTRRVCFWISRANWERMWLLWLTKTPQSSPSSIHSSIFYFGCHQRHSLWATATCLFVIYLFCPHRQEKRNGARNWSRSRLSTFFDWRRHLCKGKEKLIKQLYCSQCLLVML